MFALLKKKQTQHLLLSVLLLFVVGWVASQSGIMEGFENTQYNPNISGIVDKHVKGISRNDIPEGDEDLYILKSEIVPPVCPQCPEPVVIEKKDCPPCPACERCPEPSYKCEMIPNYDANVGFGDSNQMPRPFLNDFSQF